MQYPLEIGVPLTDTDILVGSFGFIALKQF
jgi:hypothetical protein